MATRALSLSLRRDLAELARLAEAVEAFGDRLDLPAGAVFKVNLALEELVTNVVNHGDGGAGLIEVSLTLGDDGAIVAVVEDDGPPFDPFAQAPAPDLAAAVEDRAVGGLGVHLVRSLTDEARHERAGGRNRVTLVLRAAGGDGGRP